MGELLRRVLRPGHWHRHSIGRWKVNWYIGSGNAARNQTWWRERYPFRFSRQGISIGPLFSTFWTKTRTRRAASKRAKQSRKVNR